MIETSKCIGWYTDCFGEEHDIYEQVPHYTVSYTGWIYEGDSNGRNSFDTDDFHLASRFYDNYPASDVRITDNETGFFYEGDEWWT